MNAGAISELSSQVICSGFAKSPPGATRNRSELGRRFLSVIDPARVDANTMVPSGANTGSKLCTRTSFDVLPPSVVSLRQVPVPPPSITYRFRPSDAPARAAKISCVPS